MFAVYAHIGKAIKTEDQCELTFISLQIAMALMSHFVLSFSKLFEVAKAALDQHADLKTLADKWPITWNEKDFLKPFDDDRLKKPTP